MLGPLLFILYINDIVSICECDEFISLFADDTLVAVEESNIDGANLKINIVLKN